jgi:mannose-1-phosphate guanylyltransferase
MAKLVGRGGFSQDSDKIAELADVYSRIADRTTIDYGLMEESERVACVPAEFAWSDVGSWAALCDLLDADDAGNVFLGDHLGDGDSGAFVFSRGDRLVATIGLDDIVIVDTPDALLVCARDRTEDVKRIVAALRERGRDDLL